MFVVGDLKYNLVDKNQPLCALVESEITTSKLVLSDSILKITIYFFLKKSKTNKVV